MNWSQFDLLHLLGQMNHSRLCDVCTPYGLRIPHPKCPRIQNCLSSDMMLLGNAPWSMSDFRCWVRDALLIRVRQIFPNLKKIRNPKHFWSQAFEIRDAHPADPLPWPLRAPHRLPREPAILFCCCCFLPSIPRIFFRGAFTGSLVQLSPASQQT